MQMHAVRAGRAGASDASCAGLNHHEIDGSGRIVGIMGYFRQSLAQRDTLAAMMPNEKVVTWWCSHYNKSGRLAFINGNSVGERLDLARAEHNVLSPNCELDWHQVLVRMDIDEHRS